MKNIFLSEHDEMVKFLKKASVNKEYVLINVDAHPDLSLPSDELDFDNFIITCVTRNYFSKIIWIKDNKSTDMEDGFYEFNVFWDSDFSEWKCDLEHPMYFLNNKFTEEKERAEDIASSSGNDFKKVQLEVISQKNLSRSKFAGLNWVLSIDCDFFSAANPFKSDLLNSAAILGEQKVIEIKNNVLKIKTYQEWNHVKKNLIVSKEWNAAKTLIEYGFLETFYSNEEIEEKMLAIIKFLKTNFEKQKCLSVLTCFSFFSGYTQRERCPKIVSTIDAVFKNFDYFWEKA